MPNERDFPQKAATFARFGRRVGYTCSSMRFWIAACLAWLLLPSFGGGLIGGQGSVAAQVPEALRGRSVVEVEIVGPVRRTTRVRELGVPLGVPLTRSLLRRTVRRLLASGRWADVQIDAIPQGEGVRLSAYLVPRVEVLRVDIEGNDAFDDGQVTRAVAVRPGTEVTPQTLDEMRRRLTDAYADRGFEGAQIELRLRETDDPARQILRVLIQEGEPTRIGEVRFVGDTPPRGVGVRGAMDLDEGDRVDVDALAEAPRLAEASLREAGYYGARLGEARIEREPDSARVRIVFRLHTGPRFRLRVSGAGPIPRDDVVDALRLPEEGLGQSLLPAMAARVRDLYARHGYADGTVEVLPVAPRRPPPGYDAILLVRIDHGPRLVVQRRFFPGAAHYAHDFLEEQTASFLEEATDVGNTFAPVDGHDVSRLFGRQTERREARPPAFDASRIWYEPAYEAAAEHVQELYRADGFLAARVGPAVLEREASDEDEEEGEEEGEGRAVVRLPVVEGPRAYLHRVSLSGNRQMATRDVLEAAALERGQPFSRLALEQAKDRIVAAYQAQGFYYASVDLDVRFSADRTRAEAILEVHERFEVRVDAVEVSGAERTSERSIRRVAGIEEGTLLTPQLLRRAQERLLELGVFSGVSASPIDPDLAARHKRVALALTERRTQYLDFRLGVSTAQGARVGLEYGIRNIRGLALEASLRAQFGYQFFFLDDTLEDRFDALTLRDRLERRVVLTLSAPYIGIPDVRASLSLGHMRENERNFGLDANTLNLTLGWRPHRTLNFSLSAGLENNRVEVLGAESYDEVLRNTTDPRLRGLLRVPEGTSTLVASSLVTNLDRRDNPFSPTRGFFATGTLEWAKTTRDSVVERAEETERFSSHHLRFLLSASGYVPLGRRVVFATQARFGRVVHLASSSETYPNRKFFLGGVDTVRGYLQDSLVPQDIADEICDPSADDCALPEDFNVNAVVQGGDVFLVVRGELRFPILGSFRGGVFVDFGNSWVSASELNPIRLRPTAGFGVRISTPVGPIAFDYGILLARRSFLQEPFGSFHFSIGLF